MKFVEYGNPKGKIVIYFHGAPGSPKECAIFDEHAKANGLHIICYDRFSIDSSVQGQVYYKFLANAIISKANGKKIDLIGFSIGCHAAIETSLYLGTIVRNLHLISAAAPIEGGNFIEDMAGKMVFSLAMKRPFIFTLLSYWQGLLVKIMPNTLLKILFASARGEDKKLSQTTAFNEYITPVFSHCFNINVKGYIREVNQYVTPWEESVLNCGSHTQIWHGTHDNWSPVSMAKYLRKKMSASTNLELMEGLSHYTCLYAAAPKICSQLSEHSE